MGRVTGTGRNGSAPTVVDESSDGPQPNGRTQHSHTIEAILDAISGVMPGERLIYLATPINGGPTIVSGSSQKSSNAGHVVENIRRARTVADRLRRETGDYVFDPTCFARYDGWTQEHYIELCLAILERFAHIAVFAPGWEYSRGCLREYVQATCLGIPCKTPDLEFLDVATAIRLLNSAVAEAPAHPVVEAQRCARDRLAAVTTST